MSPDKRVGMISCLLISCVICYAGAQLAINVDKRNGKFTVMVEDTEVIDGMDIFVMHMGKRYSVSEGGLKLMKQLEASGMDVLGKWTEEAFHWEVVGAQPPAMFRTSIRSYQDHPTVTFGQHFLDGLTNTSTGDANKLVSGFPCFTVSEDNEIGFLAFGGIMVGATGMATGTWGPDVKGISSGLDSGPLVLFDSAGHSAVISSFVNPMAGSAVYDSSTDTPVSSWGVMGMAEMIPKGFEYWTILHYSDQGINKNMASWGQLMRKYYNKDYSFRESDFINNYIGYWTDNGAYYYYLTETGANYQDTILDVFTYSKSMGIPYRYVQYDSWWYPKGPGGGVTEWVADPKIFPNGLKYLWEKTGWAVIAHNRWWSDKTKYAKANGGPYNFIVESNTTKKSVPNDWMFWDDLLKTTKEWGLLTYEQDWLNVEFDTTDALRSDVLLGRTWLNQMGKGAARNGMTIQYCMSPSRHILQSLEIPVVTQFNFGIWVTYQRASAFWPETTEESRVRDVITMINKDGGPIASKYIARVSNDYQPGNDQWKIGISSIFAHQMAVAPFKDNFWTTQNQTGNVYNKWEPHPELQSLVSTLSTGPVGPSDKIGCSDVKLIMKSCNADGLILKPDVPAMAINQQIINHVFGSFAGEVWTTYSEISGWPFVILFAADFATMDAVYVTPDDVNWPGSLPDSKMFSVYSPTQVADFSYNSPLKLTGCTKAHFCVYYTAPKIQLMGKELVLHGELDKWVPMTSKRVSQIEVTSADVYVSITGGVGEKVNFTYMYDGKVSTVMCSISPAGSALISIMSQSCTSM